jgi:DNA-binding CsgD family transcriptional regulator
VSLEGWAISGLLGRGAETAALAGVLAAVRDGRSGVLVVRGDPGVGKTVLLEWVAGRAGGMRVARVAGVQAEMGLGFAGLHQLLVPFLGGLDGLPGPQRLALGSAFGLVGGPVPDRFLVGLAALTLLTDAAAGWPVLCVVDDAQWLDQASVEVLGFVARRLYADRVGMVFTVREGEGQAAVLAGLPELVLEGLPAGAAGELLAASVGVPVDGRVSAQVVAGVAGNPLALVELAGELTAEELSGAVPLGWPLRFGGRLEELYLARIQALPAGTRALLLVAAADPTGDPALVYAAAGQLGAGPEAGEAAGQLGAGPEAGEAAGQLGAGPEAGEAAGAGRLVSWQPRVRFRHPLIRSAAYYAAPAGQRRAAHAALAAVTDPDTDPDRRAWHLAEAAAGPDEQVAAELERSAGRAQARGGLAAAAAFLERSVLLTADPARHADRILAAAQARMQAGAFGKALELLASAETQGSGPLDELASARVDLLRGHIAFASSLGRDAPSLLLKAAGRLEPFAPELARQTYLLAWMAGAMAGYLAEAGILLEISRAARALPPLTGPPRPADLILEGLARLVTDGPATAAPPLQQAVNVLAAEDMTTEDGLRWGWFAANALWDYETGHAIIARQVQLARSTGALEQLTTDLVPLAMSDAWRGDFAAGASLIAETDTVAEVTGARIAPFARMFIAALRGNQAEFTSLTAAATATAAAEGQGVATTNAHWVAAILYNGFGRYADAFAEAWQAREEVRRTSLRYMLVSMWALPELIEAAVRTGRTQVAADALAELAETTQAGGTDYGLGIEARSRALVSEGAAAEGCYREATERLGRTRMRPDLARAHLLYGEWLRRQRRRRDARDQLRTGLEMFDSIGMQAFAARARAELRATGERAQPRGPGPLQALTPQEEQIAQLVAERLSNRDIAARLFISTSTVEYHLSKVFRKLSVTSRAELARALGNGTGTPALPG